MMRSVEHNRIFIGLGSNLGEPAGNLARAVELLNDHFQARPVLSPVYRSEPVGFTEQSWFLNQAVCFSSNQLPGPIAVLKILKDIENAMGRVPTVRYGPRLIDLDLLFYKDWVFECAGLVIPHPRFEERSFVLRPLLDLDQELIDPRSGLSIREIWEQNRRRLSRCFRYEKGY